MLDADGELVRALPHDRRPSAKVSRRRRLVGQANERGSDACRTAHRPVDDLRLHVSSDICTTSVVQRSVRPRNRPTCPEPVGSRRLSS
jgi:hypothetical protein